MLHPKPPNGSAAASPTPCFAGDGPAAQRCPRCGRWFCERHGRALCAVCRRPRGLAPSPLLFYGTIALLAVSSVLAAFQVVAWRDEWAVSMGHGLARALTPVATPTQPPTPSPTPPVEPTAAPGVTVNATSEPAPASPPHRTHIIQPGDTLLGIALRFDITVEALMQANPHASPAALRIGQELVIRGPNP